MRLARELLKRTDNALLSIHPFANPAAVTSSIGHTTGHDDFRSLGLVVARCFLHQLKLFTKFDL